MYGFTLAGGCKLRACNCLTLSFWTALATVQPPGPVSVEGDAGRLGPFSSVGGKK